MGHFLGNRGLLILFVVLMEAREHPFDELRKKAFTTDVALPIAFERSYTWDVKMSRMKIIVIGDGRHHTLFMVLI